jgi:Tfp pilus assembly protein PilF
VTHRTAPIASTRPSLLYRTLGYRFCEAECFTNLGDCYQRDGDVDAAEYAWRQALELLDELEPDAGIQVRARLAREPQVGSTMSTCRNAAPSTSDE